MSVIDDFSAFYAALTGRPPDAAFVARVLSVCELSGRDPDDFPAYLCAIARDLAARRERPPTEIPARDRGSSWLLAELTPALPGTTFRNDGVDVFAVPDFGLAATIGSDSGPETFAVGRIDGGRTAEPRIVLDTFDPTPEQIRLWVYSPNVLLAEQDEHLAVSHPTHVPLLIELASDPACPKRTYVLAILDELLASPARGGYDRALMGRASAQASNAAPADVREWASDLAYLVEYIDGHGAVDRATAERVAAITMVGRRRPAVTLELSAAGPWTIWIATVIGQPVDHLHVALTSGALVWSKRAASPSDLAPFANPARRDDPLHVRINAN